MSQIPLELAFRIFGPNYPAAYPLALDFALLDADATILAWRADGTGWDGAAQRVWGGVGWVPAL